mmetsp:Transcript_13668/g.28859  ORF Transcript_13668/g.28859 Transcript_13668/m.28859 type:complete len:83 (+) Transcript_13668:227-475(+)
MTQAKKTSREQRNVCLKKCRKTSLPTVFMALQVEERLAKSQYVENAAMAGMMSWGMDVRFNGVLIEGDGICEFLICLDLSCS